MPHVLVAPDKFKGTLSADEVADGLRRGLEETGCSVHTLPVADGGEGTAAALVAARGGTWLDVPAHDAIGRPVSARVALLDDGRTAVVEAAAASGLWRLTSSERDALGATTAGTGELILAAQRAGATSILVAVGGSATTDGGAGAIEVIGDRLRAELVVACDVASPWEDAAPVFGPQKGASPDAVTLLRARMDALAATAPRDPRGRPRTGAAGGLAGGLWAWLGARLVGGADLVLDEVGFDAHLPGADLVVTGEGRIDPQTAVGKAAGVVASRSRAAGVRCVAVVGSDALPAADREAMGIARVLQAGTPDALVAAGRLLGTELRDGPEAAGSR